MFIKHLRWLALSSGIIFLSACGGGGNMDCLNPDSLSCNLDLGFALGDRSFTGPNIRLIGRYDQADPHFVSSTWAGSAIEFRFKGVSYAALNLTAPKNVHFKVEEDSETWYPRPAQDADYTVIELKGAADNIEHKVRITRLSGPEAGISTFNSLTLTDGEILPAPKAPYRRLLEIGDAISTGYGVLGSSTDTNCGLVPSTEYQDQQSSYTAIAARFLGADLQSISASGVGVWTSNTRYGHAISPMPELYNRVLFDSALPLWKPKDYVPAAIIVNLGTNDLWEGASLDSYQTAMEGFTTQLRLEYPSAKIYLMVSSFGPAIFDHTAQQAALQNVMNNRIMAGDNAVFVLDVGQSDTAEGYGCFNHPNLVTNQRLSTALVARLGTDLGW